MISLLVSFSSSPYGWLWSVVGLCAGSYLFCRGFVLLQRKRLLSDTPASKIRSASIGLVELSGLAIGPYTMQAPVTNATCYYYRTTAWQLKQSGKEREWEKVADESLHLPFYLDDNTGRVLVDLQGAELDLHRDFHEEYDVAFMSSVMGLPPSLAGFLARHGISGGKPLRVDEYCIKPKNALFILGTLAPNPRTELSPTPVRTIASEPSKFTFSMNVSLGSNSRMADRAPLRSSLSVTRTSVKMPAANDGTPQEVIRLSNSASPANSTAMTQQQKVAAALAKAGINNPAAWAAAGVLDPGVSVDQAGAGPTNKEPASAAGDFDPHPSTVLMKGSNNPLFLVSWRSQREVVQSLSWKSTAMIWGGPALILLSLYVLLSHFGWM